MTTSLKAKLLQHFASKKANGGFTLIELLVVVIIIGILSAIALPSFLNQGNKARQSEAQTYVGSMNRAQQVNFLEEGNFAADLAGLNLGIPAETESYDYDVQNGVTMTGATGDGVINRAISDQAALRDYAGPVALSGGGNGQEVTSTAVLCEADTIDLDLAAAEVPTVANGSVGCPGGMIPLGVAPAEAPADGDGDGDGDGDSDG